MNRLLVAATAALAFSTTAVVAVDDAHACGGLFCDGAGPTQVNQAAERIIFSQNPDGTVTTVVQIMYQGPTDRFGWLLPVPGIPEVGISSDAAFQQLQNATNPQYNLVQSIEGECKEPRNRANSTQNSNNGSFNNGDFAAAPEDDGGVTVLAEGATGPYDWVVIQVDGQGDNTQLALDWLSENNYQVTNVGPELIGPYIEEGYNLLAVRLQKTSDAGSIRPLKLTYEEDHPMIPIKLTAVAANDDMGVMTWVLGSSRAVPVNYKSLELNDSLLNWFNANSNYNQTVIAAANEASGQGFVTEYADGTSTLDQVVFSDFDQQQWDQIQQNAAQWDDNRLVDEVWNAFGFRGWDGLSDVVDQVFPDITAEQRELILSCGSCEWREDGGVPPFDHAAFVLAVGDFVVDPMAETQELIDSQPYVTRMYTTMSAHEMTLDPSFDFNPDLEDVSNVHTADWIIECNKGVEFSDATWRIELPSGLVVRGQGQSRTWPIQPDEMMPATLQVREVGTSGPGTVVRDNYETVQQQLEEANAKVPINLGGSKAGGGGCGCGSTSGDAGALALLFAPLFFATRRRRRG